MAKSVCLAEIRRLGWQPAKVAARTIEIADDREVEARIYIGKVQWLNETKEVVVVCLEGDTLLGMELLAPHKLTIENRVINIE